METSAKYHISFWKEIPFELSCIISIKCHMKPESVFPVTFPVQNIEETLVFLLWNLVLPWESSLRDGGRRRGFIRLVHADYRYFDPCNLNSTTS